MPDFRGVLITRPEPMASATADLIAARGFTPIVAPLLQVRPRRPKLPEPARLQAVLVTSGNALPPLVRAHGHVPLLVVGDATARRAAEFDFASVTSAGGDAKALAALAVRMLEPGAGPVLVAAGARRGEELARALRAAGFSVLRRVLYKAMPVGRLPAAATSALDAESVVAALFFSGETAAAFVRLVTEAGLVQRLGAIEALAIGERAAAALRLLPLRGVRVALRPTQEALLGMLE